MTIRATIFGEHYTAHGVTGSLRRVCQALIDAGHDAATPLHAYRGDMLCLKVRSIGEGARLVPAGNSVGFRYVQDVDTARYSAFQRSGVSDIGSRSNRLSKPAVHAETA
jgi:hypothetical protein